MTLLLYVKPAEVYLPIIILPKKIDIGIKDIFRFVEKTKKQLPSRKDTEKEMSPKMNQKYPDAIGNGYLYIKQGKKGGYYLSGFVEFERNLILIRVNFLAFPLAEASFENRKPAYQLKVLSWEPAPERKLYYGKDFKS